MTSHEVALTIQRQIGKRAFFMMGAKDLMSTENRSLRFKIGRNAKSVSHIEVTLDPRDLYTVRFTRQRMSGGSLKVTVVAEVCDVFCDSLHTVFEEHTGLRTSL